MSAREFSDIHCAECYRPVPGEASFCPHCGRAARAVVRMELARRRNERRDSGDASLLGLDIEFIPATRRLAREAGIAAGRLIATLLQGVIAAVRGEYFRKTATSDSRV